MGEYPLAWAACCANESVYNLLLDNNADPDAQDTFGNMILHMVVVCDKLVSKKLIERQEICSLKWSDSVRICSAMHSGTQNYQRKMES